MARLYPFQGLRYNAEQVGAISQVVSPPYDIITPEEERVLSARSIYNAVHIDLPRISDPEANAARYEEAGRLWRAWQSAGVLQREKQAALYAYRQTYRTPGSRAQRVLTGFIAALELAAWDKGIVLPHEHTFAKPKADRLSLMRATAANLSPVYGFYSDPKLQAEEALAPVLTMPPTESALDDNGDLHEVWVVSGAAATTICRALSAATVFIADGHHRYETALDYQAERAAVQADAAACWNTVMMMLVNLDAGGLTILPTHRVLHSIPAPDLAALREELERLFAVRELSLGAEAAAEQAVALQPGEFAAYVAPGKYWHIARKSTEAIVRAMPSGRARAWQELDVAVLHSLVLEGALRLERAAIDQQKNIRYTRDALDACRAVDEGAAALSFLLPAPSVSSVKEIALAGDVMPQKSTYFYPKLLTGLVFADLNASLP